MSRGRRLTLPLLVLLAILVALTLVVWLQWPGIRSPLSIRVTKVIPIDVHDAHELVEYEIKNITNTAIRVTEQRLVTSGSTAGITGSPVSGYYSPRGILLAPGEVYDATLKSSLRKRVSVPLPAHAAFKFVWWEEKPTLMTRMASRFNNTRLKFPPILQRHIPEIRTVYFREVPDVPLK